MSLNQLREGLGIHGGISEREAEAVKNFASDKFVQEQVPELFSESMTCFLFEAVIRPLDKALVLHLKHLPPALRNVKFFDFATAFIRDRIGKYRSLNSSFIGEVDAANKLNSLDLMFTDYYPAKIGNMEFIKSHCVKIGKELDDLLIRELGDYAASIKRS